MPAKIDPTLAAIQRLTRPHQESQPVPGEARVHYAQHDALIAQLRRAIGGDQGKGGGVGQPAQLRTPIDPDALDRYLRLDTRLRQFHTTWCHTVAGAHEPPERILSRAYLAYSAAVRRGDVSEHTQHEILGWLVTECLSIEEKLSPPTRLELPGAECPECGLSNYTTVTNKDRTSKDRSTAWYETEHHAATLTVAYRPDGQNGLSRSYVRCGCCNTTWHGSQGIRYIAYEINRPALAEELAMLERTPINA